MAAKKVTTTFTVSFTTPDSSGILLAEVDDRDPADGGLNTKTSFAPGDPVVYLVFCGEGVTLNAQYHSWGSHSGMGAGVSVLKEEMLTFYGPDQLSQTLKYPVESIDTFEWVGNSVFGNPKFNGQNVEVSLASGSTYGVGVLKVSYYTVGLPFKLVHAPLGYPEYEIATLVVGTYVPPIP